MTGDALQEVQGQGKRWLFLLAGDARKASSRVRGFWIADELRTLGERCTLLACTSPLRILYAALLIPFHDVVIFQKTYSKYHCRLQSLCKWLGKATYIDIDDAPSRTHNRVTLANFGRMSRQANAVLAGNEVLAELARTVGGSPQLVPTGIRCSAYPEHRQVDHAPVRIGWIGDAGQYIRDLQQVILPALATISTGRDIIFRVIGAGGQSLPVDKGAFALERVDELDWSSADAVAAQLRDIDIGVYPLLKNDFNDCKCGFKALEYMACGIPVVASPNPANSRIISHEVDGLLANTPAEWAQALARLSDDHQLRQALGSAGRARVTQHYDTKLIARKILSITNADTPGSK